MSESDPTGRHHLGGPAAAVLNGWKEIAAYIGKSERTAIRWEAELGLPIHRMQGKAGEIVFARPEEIEAWRVARERPPVEPAAPDAPAAEAETAGPGAPVAPRRAPLVVAAFAAGAFSVAALGGFVAWSGWVGPRESGPVPGPPFQWSVAGSTLVVSDEQGRELWRHAFATQLSASAYESPAQPHDQAPMVAIVDIDGDGPMETLFVVTSVADPVENKLYCFESDGRVRFVHGPDAVVRFGAEPYGPPFGVRHLLVTKNADGTHAIWIGASHRQWFPTLIRKLDRDGRGLGDYWTNGHVKTLADVTVGGRRLLAVGGTSNETKGASLSLLDYDRPAGRAPASRAEFLCSSCPPTDPVAFLTFPQLPIAKRLESRPCVAELLPQPDGGLAVAVVQATTVLDAGPPDGIDLTVHYAVDSTLRARFVELGDAYRSAAARLPPSRRGEPSSTAVDAAEARVVRHWDGQAFADVR